MTTEAFSPTLRGAVQTVQRIASRQPVRWTTPSAYRDEPGGPALVAIIHLDCIKLWARTVDGRRGTLEAIIRYEADPIAQVEWFYRHGYLTQEEKLANEDAARERCENCRIYPGITLKNGRLLCCGCAIPARAREVAA